MLQVKNLSTGYGKKQVLFDVSFEIKAGDILLLIGSNGSGKSTLLKAIYRVLPPFVGARGEVSLDGEDISHYKPSKLVGKQMVYVPQKNNCFENLSVKENLEVSVHSLPKQERKYAVEASLVKLPLLVRYLEKYPYQLSGGERQLLALAMAISHRPKMLLLDEPLAGLTGRNIELVKEQIWQLNQQGVTILLVEHRIKETISLTKKAGGLKLGKFVGEFDLSDSRAAQWISGILL